MNGQPKVSAVSSSSKQSAGQVPKNAATSPPPEGSKRNSGIFSFLKWFRSTSRESVNSDSIGTASAGSTESLSSTGTAASFSYVPPAAYAPNLPTDRRIQPGPETDTYRARLKQRDRVREKDKNITLRKKYNLFFSRDKDKDKDWSSKKPTGDSFKSLPLMTKHKMEEEKGHRRTNSDSSRNRHPGAYLHVKGKRKAPAPPPKDTETSSLRRKKRLAPQPPLIDQRSIITALETSPAEDVIEYVDLDAPREVLNHEKSPEVVQNDSLRLDHGLLQPLKNLPKLNASPKAAPKHRIDFPASPKPWYKRGVSGKRDSKYEPVMAPFDNNNDKRKSNMMFLTNISELDREATEILKKNKSSDMPEFMKTKVGTVEEHEPEVSSGVPSKRKSAKDLIAKFNAITNVTKVTVNTALFGGAGGGKRDYFGREAKEGKLVVQKQVRGPAPLMKSETSACVPAKSSTPALDRSNWKCPKCNGDNDYWRIICTVCSTIKPYFDDLGNLAESGSPQAIRSKWAMNKLASSNSNNSGNAVRNHAMSKETPATFRMKENELTVKPQLELPQLSRSRTQIHFYHNPQTQKTANQSQNQESKHEEKEKLKKMLIEMKNSLPKRKNHVHLNQNRKSTIDETPENYVGHSTKGTAIETKDVLTEIGKSQQFINKPLEEDPNLDSSTDEKHFKIERQFERKQEAITLTQGKPCIKTSKKVERADETYQLLRQKDFEDIYAEKSANPHVYVNLGKENHETFLNVSNHIQDLKNSMHTKLAAISSATDTLEINKLLKQLETAIAKGDLQDASGYARELAQLKVNCSVIRQRSGQTQLKQNPPDKNSFLLEMYVEDRISHRGPIPIHVQSDQTLRGLKDQVQKEFDIPVEVQRWILGKELAMNENATLREHNVLQNGTPIFLYLVAPTAATNALPKKATQQISIMDTKKVKSEVLGTDSSEASTSGIVLTKASQLPREDTPLEDHNTTKYTSPPKIVGGQLKVHVMIKPTSSSETEMREQDSMTQRRDLVTAVKTTVVVQQGPPKLPPRAEQEDFSVYDKTIIENKAKQRTTEATKNWVCHRCTLVNISTANVCSVCATLRLKTNEGGDVKIEEIEEPKEHVHNRLHYYELMNLDQSDLVSNADPFECLICFTEVPSGTGVTLRECLHQFCRGCLRNLIEYCEEAEVKCPYRDPDYSCDIALQDREVKALVPRPVYEQFLARSVAQAENKMDKSFHCKTPDCTGWCIYEDNVNEFRCPLCKKTNCLTCQAIHSGLNCRQYQDRINFKAETDEGAKETRVWLNELVDKGEALMCPACHVILMKKWGCDWVRCSMCKTEICWVTRGLRWGPGGKGDVSSGCRCGVNGVKCHAKCNYCH